MRLGIGHPQPVRFEERTLRGSLDRSLASATLSKSSWMAMKVGPRTFQCACLTCACRSMAAARWRLSRATDRERIYSGRLLAVLYISISSYPSDCGKPVPLPGTLRPVSA